MLAPLGGADPFEAPLLGDFSGELAGFGDSRGFGDSGPSGLELLGDSGFGEDALEASLGFGEGDKSLSSEGLDDAFSRSSLSSGRGRG